MGGYDPIGGLAKAFMVMFVVLGLLITAGLYALVNSSMVHEYNGFKYIKYDYSSRYADSGGQPHVVVLGYHGTPPNPLEIPSEIEGMPVTEVRWNSMLFTSFRKTESIVLPDSVTTIGAYAFASCAKLTEIRIPDSVTSIEEYAFNGCKKLEEITLPNSVAVLGRCAFVKCKNLQSVQLSSRMESIEGAAFADCTALEEIVLPQGVTRIGEGAFIRCKALTSVTIPDGVTVIEKNAFANTSLTDVYYGGSQENWDSIQIHSSNKVLRKAALHLADEL